MRDRAATRALLLGLLALPFGVLSPFAIVSGVRSLRRIRRSGGGGAFAAGLGLAGGVIGAVLLVGGILLWLAIS